jgi:hypothetical protein
MLRLEKPKEHWTPESLAQYTSIKWWPIAFYNNGKHLFLTSGHPRFVAWGEFQFLPFRMYCQGGNLNGVKFRHLGHLYGLNGGPATVEIQCSGITTIIGIPPRRIAWVEETAQLVNVYI